PQVGMVNLASEFAANNNAGTPPMPFPECGAMTQGYIGYHLQQAIQRELSDRKMDQSCAAIVTQVVVDPNDPAFQKPTKPVGMFYDREKAEAIIKETGYTFVEDAGRGFRRVVPSPIPQKIVELPVVRKLVEDHVIVITVGGGGIPVIEDGNGYQGVAAVIDKDRASARLALDLNADMLVILTAVEKVSLNYGKPDQKDLDQITVREAEEYISQGHFAPGSMLPKVESCLTYLSQSPDGTALITSLEKAREALQGTTGTRIIR
ncbi:MAG: carbamate kinase, partial [Erysipelotrichaceae bacterium]|nr:carbamate kinase [Erysipelotrichaceae bacterium]